MESPVATPPPPHFLTAQKQGEGLKIGTHHHQLGINNSNTDKAGPKLKDTGSRNSPLEAVYITTNQLPSFSQERKVGGRRKGKKEPIHAMLSSLENRQSTNRNGRTNVVLCRVCVLWLQDPWNHKLGLSR